MISTYPKIFALGSDFIKAIFDGGVSIEEKLDGSAFTVGKINGELFMRSKNVQLYRDNPQKMFQEGVDYILSIEDKLPDDIVFYFEYLRKLKHNCIKYDRIPKNHLMLFGASDKHKNFIPDYRRYAKILNVDSAPLLYKGKVNNIKEIHKLLETKSFLGGTKIEGFVVKNYSQPFLLGGQPIPLMTGKYVSEKFKEVHDKNWKRNTGKGKFETFKEKFRAEARWDKGIQHLRDSDELEFEPRDIGKLIKEIQRDIEEEEKENIKEFLYNNFKREILGYAIKKFPEYYKEYLAKRSFE